MDRYLGADQQPSLFNVTVVVPSQVLACTGGGGGETSKEINCPCKLFLSHYLISHVIPTKTLDRSLKIAFVPRHLEGGVC